MNSILLPNLGDPFPRRHLQQLQMNAVYLEYLSKRQFKVQLVISYTYKTIEFVIGREKRLFGFCLQKTPIHTLK
jgi:hypothetical protein